MLIHFISIGCNVQVKAGNSSKVLAQMTLNATTMSVMLNNLTTSATYNIRVVAYTRVGAGPYSQPVRLNSILSNRKHFIESAAAKHTSRVHLNISWSWTKN